MFDHDQENADGTTENADLGETIAMNYTVCERDIEALLVFYFQRQESNRIGIAIMAIVGFFSIQIAVIKIIAILISREPVTPGSLILIAVAALVGLWLGRVIWNNRNVHARARTVMASKQFRGSLQDLGERVECVFSRKGVSFEMRNVSLELNWDAILGVARTDDYFFLVLSPTTTRSIPLSGLPFGIDSDHLAKFCETKMNGPVVDYSRGESVLWSDVDAKSGAVATRCERCDRKKSEDELKTVVGPLQWVDRRMYCWYCRLIRTFFISLMYFLLGTIIATLLVIAWLSFFSM